MPKAGNNTLVRRVGSQDGASLLIALVFVLVAGMIAAVVISSAAVNAERVNPQRENEQAYLAVESAMRSVDSIIARDVNGLQVELAADGTAHHMPISTDKLGLGQWVADQLSMLAQGKDATDKNIIVTAQGLGAVESADIPKVLLTFSIRENGVFVRACQYVDAWATEGVPDDQTQLKADLVESAEYAHYLSKQVASLSGFQKGAECTVSLNATKASGAGSE